ncbi:DNA-binding response regulator [Microbacterium sorbitolivorans]|uniref:DNA-binding response regulator n=1 Tax=Microbacterium sorbitolivorans TaxID=1867410 RepID=A0A367Y1P3_9MICO|nr:response regulator transcription factor [Microbacterium sorbitolivorans]RCK59757.1 DNA-binding response regulator [Microbacterium sorbitolivorans]GGF39695.1 DNA-binding response regulator [Microbacterium sorbitolivorans]
MTSSDIPVRVVIVDDDPFVRRSLTRLLGSFGAAVVGDAADGSLAIEAVRAHHPDVVLMDVSMPVLGGPEATVEILRLAPSSRVIAMTSLGTERALTSMIAAGARGFLHKERLFDELEQAIEVVMAGDGFASPRATAQLMRRAADDSTDSDRQRARERFATLTEREREVAVLVAQGASNPAIAERLYIGVTTVKNHLAQIHAKFGVAQRSHVTVIVDRAGHGPDLG